MPRMHKGLLAALVVPPPPTPPILLETSQRITRELTIHHQGGHNRGPNFESGSWPILAGQPPPPLVALRCAVFSGESARHHPRESTHPRGFLNPCRSQRPPSALGHRRRPSVDLGHYDPAALSPRVTLRQLNPLQEDRNIAMSFPKAQSATYASAAPKWRLITLESAILRCGGVTRCNHTPTKSLRSGTPTHATSAALCVTAWRPKSLARLD